MTKWIRRKYLKAIQFHSNAYSDFIAVSNHQIEIDIGPTWSSNLVFRLQEYYMTVGRCLSSI